MRSGRRGSEPGAPPSSFTLSGLPTTSPGKGEIGSRLPRHAFFEAEDWQRHFATSNLTLRGLAGNMAGKRRGRCPLAPRTQFRGGT